MRLMKPMIIMFVGSFLIQYFLMPPIMVNKNEYITNNLGKVYLATIMGLFMVTLETLIHDHQYGVFSWKLYTILAGLVTFFVYLYRRQVHINNKQYLEEMIEHHSMALLMSEEMLKKTDNYDVTKLAKKIIQTQTDEIHVMKHLINKLD
jgi:hypothetical protein